MNEDQAPRQNSQGDPCPPWCVTDHDARIGDSRFTASWHGTTETPVIHTPSGYVHATGYQHGLGDGDVPQIALSCLAPGSVVLLDVRDSGKLADFVEQLADSTPDQHHELAAQIRQAAAGITEA